MVMYFQTRRSTAKAVHEVVDRAQRNHRASGRTRSIAPPSPLLRRRSTVQFQPKQLVVGERVEDVIQGMGTVAELMADGTTRVEFDSGEQHGCALAIAAPGFQRRSRASSPTAFLPPYASLELLNHCTKQVQAGVPVQAA